MSRIHRHRFALAVAGVITVFGGLLLRAVHDSGFTVDDWQNLGVAREQAGFSLHYLTLGYAGHLAPGHRLIDWILAWHLHATWEPYLAGMLALYVISVGAFAWLLRSCGVSRIPAIAAVGLLAAAPFWARTMQWAASAEHVVPATAGTLLCMAAAWSWFLRPALWKLVLSVGSLVFALAFYEKPALAVPYLLALRYFVLPLPQDTSRGTQFRKDARLLVPLIAIVVIYATTVVVGDYSGTGELSHSASAWLHLWANAWTRGTAVLVLGLGVPEYAAQIATSVVVAAQLALLALLVASVRLRVRAWRAWLFFVVFWAVNVLLIGYGRLTLLGPGLVLDPRYMAELAFLLPLTIALAFTGPRRAAAAAGDRARWAPIAAAVVALAAWAAATVHNNRQLIDSWQGYAAHTWLTNLRHDVDRLQEREPRLLLIDQDVPAAVIPPVQAPYNRLSRIAAIAFGEDVRFDSGPQLRVASAAGTVQPAPVTRLFRGTGAALLADGRARPLNDAPLLRRGAAICMPRGGLLQIKTSVPATPAGLWLTLATTRQSVPADVAVYQTVDDSGFNVPEPSMVRQSEPGSSSDTALGPGPLTAATLELPKGFCLRTLGIVTPVQPIVP